MIRSYLKKYSEKIDPQNKNDNCCQYIVNLNIRNMYSQQSSRMEATRNRGRPQKDLNPPKNQIDIQELETIADLKQQNNKLKKMLKEAQSKRTQITKQCSNLSKTIEKLEQENQELKNQVRNQEQRCEGEKYRWEELKFLNKQLSSEIEELRHQNEDLNQKLRYSSDILERKYQELEEKTYKRIEQCVKRVKKAIHYLESLSVKNLDKTREDLIENLRKSIQLLRGKYYEEMNCEGEIDQLMNPLKAMQEEIVQKSREASHFKQENIRLTEQLSKYKQMEKQQIPMFKEAIEKLKKNLAQVRSQLSENEYEKMQIKKKYEEKLKEADYKYNELFKECRKIKLEKKIYQNKLEELEADVEEQKERLIGENQMLKKIYNNNHDYPISNSSRISQSSNLKLNGGIDRKTQEKKALHKNYSTNELRTSNLRLGFQDRQQNSVEVSGYNQQSSMLSKQNLKNEICRLDQEIMQIQQSLNRQLQAYK